MFSGHPSEVAARIVVSAAEDASPLAGVVSHWIALMMAFETAAFPAFA
jgi:hypothetical protein